MVIQPGWWWLRCGVVGCFQAQDLKISPVASVKCWMLAANALRKALAVSSHTPLCRSQFLDWRSCVRSSTSLAQSDDVSCRGGGGEDIFCSNSSKREACVDSNSIVSAALQRPAASANNLAKTSERRKARTTPPAPWFRVIVAFFKSSALSFVIVIGSDSEGAVSQMRQMVARC